MVFDWVPDGFRDIFRRPSRTMSRVGPVTPWLGTLGWILVSALTFFGLAGGEANLDPLRILMVPVAVFGPIVLIWSVWLHVRNAHEMRFEIMRLRIAVLSREGREAGARPPGSPEAALDGPDGTPPPSQAPAVDEELRALIAGIAHSQRKTEAALARLNAQSEPPSIAPRPQSSRPATGPATRPATAHPAGAPASDQARLDIGPEPPARSDLAAADIVAALDFPADAQDTEGFRALRRALKDPGLRPVITAAQDVLTLLSEDGLYMDDLAPDTATPDLWRRFANGERGPDMAALAGIRDDEIAARVTERMRADTIYRDAAHHFLRMFDRLLGARESQLSDDDLISLVQTRTGRAFMLLGRSVGTFD